VTNGLLIVIGSVRYCTERLCTHPFPNYKVLAVVAVG